jgi:hypothetical protein
VADALWHRKCAVFGRSASLRECTDAIFRTNDPALNSESAAGCGAPLARRARTRSECRDRESRGGEVNLERAFPVQRCFQVAIVRLSL